MLDNLDLNEGPTNFDQRHNLVVSGMATVPRTGGLTFGWVARALSGSPFSIVDQTIDADRNGTLADPLPAGSYSGDGANAITVEHDGGRNGAYGPAFFKLDLRTGYTVDVGNGRRIELFGEIFNVTNRAISPTPAVTARTRTSCGSPRCRRARTRVWCSSARDIRSE